MSKPDATRERVEDYGEERKAIQAGHMAHLESLGPAGKIAGPFGTPGDRLAGPLADGGTHRGIGVLAAETIEEAEQWMADDPMIAGGHLVMVPLRWFAADGILLRK